MAVVPPTAFDGKNITFRPIFNRWSRGVCPLHRVIKVPTVIRNRWRSDGPTKNVRPPSPGQNGRFDTPDGAFFYRAIPSQERSRQSL